MARVTVEDCILNIPNRFDLVITAAQRAKQISSGNPLTVERDNDKDAVVSLREIADETVEIKALQEEIVESFQRKTPRAADFGAMDAEQSELVDEVSEAFADVQSQISVEEQQREMEGLSFEGENMDVED
jgi:DNA-directed RNA polymerase subunit omega